MRIVNIVSVCLIIMYVPESPKWLYEKGRFIEAKEALIYLARNNGVDVQPLTDKQFDGQVAAQEQNDV